ncbi:MAG: penicillin-binding protein 2 [Endomicrobium sp.]|jgi:penicillin-binding protein 2|nr:penicillin-binding protein 2 [Endomicrobium sp.]
MWSQESKFTYETFRKKHKLIFIFFIFLFICISIRLFYLQIIKGNKYKIIAEKQAFYNIPEFAARGTIYSKDNIILVNDKFSYVILYHSSDNKRHHLRQIIKELKKILKRDIKLIATKKNMNGNTFIKLLDNLTLEEMFKIQEKMENLKGIFVTKKPHRIYYFPESTSHIIGYTNKIRVDEIKYLSRQVYKIEDYVGRCGIEQTYDKYLRGEDGGWYTKINAKRNLLKSLKYISPKKGSNIYSTIDLNLQQIAYNALKRIGVTVKGAVVVIDVKTGAIRVLVSYPGFDTNKIGHKDFLNSLNKQNFSFFNRALQGLYAPGSLFKIITFATIMDTSNINILEKIVECNGSFKLGNRHYLCWNKHGHGKLNIINAMSRSCNIYFYKLGLDVGIKNLEKYAKKFYLGQKTGIDLPNEKNGFISNSELKKSKLKIKWHKGDTTIFAIGQGAILVTPLQMACMIANIANKGICHTPYIVEKILDSTGKEIYKHKIETNKKIILSNKTWEFLNKALLETVEKGTGLKAKLNNIKIAGKTGTAQNSHGKDHGWFISYGPADNPEIAIAVIVENGGSSGISAVPIAKKIYETYFNV